jgi:hypothetical protein
MGGGLGRDTANPYEVLAPCAPLAAATFSMNAFASAAVGRSPEIRWRKGEGQRTGRCWFCALADPCRYLQRASRPVVPAGRSETRVPSGSLLVGNLMPGTRAAMRNTELVRNALIATRLEM